MIKSIRLVDNKWRIGFICGDCGLLAITEIKKYQKDIAVDHIMKGIFQCDSCERKVGKNG